MRKRASSQGLSVHAIAGAYVVILGIDIAEELREGLRGFAIRRTDHVRGEINWMRGMKVFESLEPHPAPGLTYSSAEHPFQSFQWSDYSAFPGFDYSYAVFALYGGPGDLERRFSVEVAVTTEAVEGATHVVNFNCGSTATQEYANRFHNKKPREVGPAAYKWLSRGLVESIVEFIQSAKDAGYGLKGAFYEFQWGPILQELKSAADRGVDVSIVFDDIDNATGPHGGNEDAIRDAGLGGVVTPRANGKLMHNKFLVLTRKRADGSEDPEAVLFGSTNLTENGLYGHANCTHVVRNADIARKYLAYQAMLATDPETGAGKPYKSWTITETPAPPAAYVDGMAAVYSPRANLDALDWYASLAAGAERGLFMTFAFGMNDKFQAVYGRNDDVLRFGLMEKEWNGRNKEAQIAKIRALQARDNVVIAIGNRIPLNKFDQWLQEMDGVGGHINVHWIHLKFMLVDPLSKHPVVVTGSANFSGSSTTDNDENMLVIRDDTHVADIYLGEYMRLFSHYAFREAVDIFLKRHPGAKPADMKQGFLIEDRDWTEPYFDPRDRSARMARRVYFA